MKKEPVKRTALSHKGETYQPGGYCYIMEVAQRIITLTYMDRLTTK